MSNTDLKQLDVYINDYIDNHLPQNVSVSEYLSKLTNDKSFVSNFETSYNEELKDEGRRFITYIKLANKYEQLAILTFVGAVFLAGAIIF